MSLALPISLLFIPLLQLINGSQFLNMTPLCHFWYYTLLFIDHLLQFFFYSKFGWLI